MPAGTPTSWVISNLAAITAAYDIYCNCLKSGPAGGPGDFTMGSINQPVARGSNRSVSETDTGGLLMGEYNLKLGTMPLRGNFGARYVKTGQVATGYLPAANASLGATDNFMIRMAAAKVMSRPHVQCELNGIFSFGPDGFRHRETQACMGSCAF